MEQVCRKGSQSWQKIWLPDQSFFQPNTAQCSISLSISRTVSSICKLSLEHIAAGGSPLPLCQLKNKGGVELCQNSPGWTIKHSITLKVWSIKCLLTPRQFLKWRAVDGQQKKCRSPAQRHKKPRPGIELSNYADWKKKVKPPKNLLLLTMIIAHCSATSLFKTEIYNTHFTDSKPKAISLNENMKRKTRKSRFWWMKT